MDRTTSDQVVVGAIPQAPPGFQPLIGLLADLDRTGPGVSVLYSATGMRGVGTTQLAAGYARARRAAGWRLVAWVNAEDTATLRAGLAAAADAIGLPQDGAEPDIGDPGLAVRRRLEADGDRCLLVLDDASDPDALRPFLPARGAARVLITTTRPAAADLGTSVPVDVFSPGEALEFLTGLTSLNEAGAAAVAAELGYLPLALAQAATVLAGNLDHGVYLERLRALSAQEHVTREDEPYPPGLAEAVVLSLDAVQGFDQSGVCTAMMEIVALLSAAGVRRDLLHAAGQEGLLTHGGHPAAAVDQALERLAGWSLLSFSLDGQAVIAHRLVTRVVRERLARRGHLTAVCRAAASALEARARALAGAPDRLAVRDIPGQVTALQDHATGAAAEADEELAAALLRLRFLALYHLIELGDNAHLAIMIGEPLTADLEQALGPGHPDTLNARNSLAAAYQAAGRTDEAISLFVLTMAARERVLGPDHPDTLKSQNNLAAAYWHAGRLAAAIMLFEQTLAARERALGAEDPSTLNSRSNLAAAYREAGRTGEAIPLLEQTLADRERVLGPGHPDTVNSRHNLADAYRDAGRTGEAIPLPNGLSPRPREPGPDLAQEPPAAAARPSEGQSVPPEAALDRESAAPRPEPEPPSPQLATPELATPELATPELATPEVEAPEVAAPEVAALERPAVPGRRSDGRPVFPRRLRVPSLLAAVLILLVAGGVAFSLGGPHVSGHRSSRGATAASGAAGPGGTAAADMGTAAEWVSQQISRSAVVACDPKMCSALKARGFPAAKLLVLRPTTASPLGAEVVVATPAVRSQFGTRLDSLYAPSVIAGFGSGPDQVNVRVVAPDGAAAYLAALRQDVAARTAAGNQLLANKRIKVAARARTQLAAGEVDSRLLILLPFLAEVHPIQILAFGDAAAGASPGVPLCSVDLSGSAPAAGMTDASYVRWLTGVVRAQPAPFAGRTVVLSQGHQPVVLVEFSRPSPLGLLSRQ